MSTALTPLHFRQAILHVNRKQYQLRPGRSNSFEEIFADFQQDNISDGTRYSIFLHPKQDLVLHRLEVQFDLQLAPNASMLANGYQSWSATDQVPISEGIPALRSIARRYVGFTGDDHVKGIPHGKGYVHAWTYSLLQSHGHPNYLLASLNEKTGFTLFLYDTINSVLTARKDLDELALSHSFPGLDFCVLQGEIEDVLYNHWASLMALPAPTLAPSLIWDSSRLHHKNLSKDLILENLTLFKDGLDTTTEKEALSTDSKAHFLIGDGWETQVGDWLSPKPSFSGNMPQLVREIKQLGLVSGLWIAPWVATQHSELFKKHPDWFLKDKRGKILKVGRSHKWNGWYYALDFYHPGVRDYLSGVFHVLVDQWGFELLKLDYLFAVCLCPPMGKTRGQVMCESLEFLRRLCGQRLIFASGVPLGAAMGLVEYCSISADRHLKQEQPLSVYVRHRERSSLTSIQTSKACRKPLSGRFWSYFFDDPMESI